MTAVLLIAFLIAGCVSLAAGLALTVSQALAQRQAGLPAEAPNAAWEVGPNPASQAAALFYDIDAPSHITRSAPANLLAGLLALAAGLAGVIVAHSIMLGIAAAIFVGGALFTVSIVRAQQLRRARALEQTHAIASAIQRPVASGVELFPALLELSASHSEPGEELTRIARHVTSGVPLDAAVAEGVERIGEADFALLASAVRLHDEAIDGAPALWDRLGDLLSRRREVLSKTAALTRRVWAATSIAVALLVALVVLSWTFAPQLVATLVAQPSGQLCVGFGFAGFVLGLVALHLAMSRELEL